MWYPHPVGTQCGLASCSYRGVSRPNPLDCVIEEDCLETEYRLFPPVTIFLDLFLRAGYFFNAFD